MAFVKKTWKDRIAEFPTRRRLTKEDNTSELVTVAREEGTLSQEGDAFSAENMNDLENRIDAEFTEVNGKLDIKNKIITCTVTSDSDSPLGYFGRVSKEDCGLSDNEKIISISGYSKVGYPAIVSYQVSPSELIGITSASPEYAYIYIQYITL